MKMFWLKKLSERCKFHVGGHFEKKRMPGPGQVVNSTEVDVARAWATLVFVDSHGNSMEVPNCQQLKDFQFFVGHWYL